MYQLVRLCFNRDRRECLRRKIVHHNFRRLAATFYRGAASCRLQGARCKVQGRSRGPRVL
jgi:hypothetical protein